MVDDLQGEKNRRELGKIVDDFNKKLTRYELFYLVNLSMLNYEYIKMKFTTGDPSCFACLKTDY